MKISEIASGLIKKYGDIEVVEILHVDDMESSNPYVYEELITSTNDHTHVTELLTYRGCSGEKHFMSANMKGYIDGAMEKVLLLDFGRYVEGDEE